MSKVFFYQIACYVLFQMLQNNFNNMPYAADTNPFHCRLSKNTTQPCALSPSFQLKNLSAAVEEEDNQPTCVYGEAPGWDVRRMQYSAPRELPSRCLATPQINWIMRGGSEICDRRSRVALVDLNGCRVVPPVCVSLHLRRHSPLLALVHSGAFCLPPLSAATRRTQMKWNDHRREGEGSGMLIIWEMAFFDVEKTCHVSIELQ